MNCLSSDGLVDDSIVLLIYLDNFACLTLFLHALLKHVTHSGIDYIMTKIEYELFA